MGLFLQTAIIPDCEVWEVQEAVKNVEEWLDTLEGIKRHISCRDLVRLRELDPQNEDVYLLALAFFHFFDTHYHGTPDKAYADMEELRRIGFPGRDDGRIRWDGFPEDFLRFCERGEGQIRAGEIKSVNVSVGDYPNKTPYGNPEK